MPFRFSGHLAGVTGLAVASLCFPASVPIPAPRMQDKPGSSQGFVLEVGEQHIRDLVNEAAKFLGRTYLVPLPEITPDVNTVTIQKRLNLDAVGCEDVLSQLVYAKGFTIVPLDPLRGMYEIVANRGQRAAEITSNPLIVSADEVLRRPGLKMCVLTSVPLQHLDSVKAAQQLRPFFSAGGGRGSLQFGNPGSQGSLLLMGYSDQVAGAIRLLRDIDRPEPVRAAANSLQTELEAVQKRLAVIEARLVKLEGATGK